MKNLLFALPILVFLMACGSDDKVENPSLKINMLHTVDGAKLKMDAMLYANDLGEQFSVTKVNYYLSELELVKANGELVKIDSMWYISLNPQNMEATINLQSLPLGDYQQINFIFGLTDKWNDQSLVPVDQLQAMIWPENMGGGLHFMKLEGRFSLPEAEALNGYNTHMGNLKMGDMDLDHFFKAEVPAAGLSVGQGLTEVNLEMDLLKWYTHGSTHYSLTEFQAIMNKPEKQAILMENGQNIWSFSIKGE
ncbi:MbnP family protein [Persicobacter sp. CCB-QB2]|uniref:MbnP family protein n=1 Tax=Persicobacter sp. CCB-QB2 TaxID=1561025 RepID=UPI0006A9AF08|nr:MbnP family protein [Persicobacter sp. CCB-QB2]